MITISCAVCRREAPFTVLYSATFKPQDINPKIYTSRRVPDRVHFRIVSCKVCGLTFSNPIYDPKKILDSYKKSENPTTDNLTNSASIYTHYLKPILKEIPKERLLEIGCGDGFFLIEAKKLGFKKVYGVEPSADAVARRPHSINKKYIINDIFKKGQFKKDFFDIICFFQVLDHVVYPNDFLKNCYEILRPGGYVFAIMHDAKSFTSCLLGKKSPIFDIQHIYLFDKQTVKKIFQNNGFKEPRVFNTLSYYSLGYWLEMAPLPKIIQTLIRRFQRSTLLKISIPLKVGNMAIIAKKEESKR